MEETLTRIDERLAHLEKELGQLHVENRKLRALVEESPEGPAEAESAAAAGDHDEESEVEDSSGREGLQEMPHLHSLDESLRREESRVRELKLTPPEKYFGDPSGCRYFLAQCSMHFLGKPRQFPTSRSQVLFLVSNLGGEALRWVTPMIEHRDRLLDDYSGFEAAFKKMFDRRVTPYMRSVEFLNVKQGSRDLTSFINKFQHLAIEVMPDESTKYAVFMQGLREEIREAVQMVYPMPPTLLELIDLSLQVDLRLREKGIQMRAPRKFPAAPTSSGSSKPEVKGGSQPRLGVTSRGGSLNTQTKPLISSRVYPPGSSPRPPLTEEERARRRRENLCMYCGMPGHTVADCKLTRSGLTAQAVLASVDTPELSVPEQGKDQTQLE